MRSNAPSILLIGYGNPSRLDDGLGPALAERIEKEQIDGVTVDSDYQLSVESALDVSGHDIVIFADADIKASEPFYFREVHPSSPQTISSHRSSPETILYLAETMFNARPRGFVLGIRGYAFDGFGEGLSDRALENVEQAFRFLLQLSRSDSILNFIEVFFAERSDNIHNRIY